ncbi:uncharacterized protein CDAR_36571 [Caerostris darwini]|uniref:Uncharacterized protein n=1 Tax=Caerostris darwini TaxID=1538125 RepID=A0AAV4UVJ9_9ARAC|nr:uncharacterized protein CDAR_36571 [Caerostris darwini]
MEGVDPSGEAICSGVIEPHETNTRIYHRKGLVPSQPTRRASFFRTLEYGGNLGAGSGSYNKPYGRLMVSVMNLLHGDPHSRSGTSLGHHPHLSMLGGGNNSPARPPAQSTASHQRSPFAIQELLGLGNSETSSPSPAGPPAMGAHPSPYQPRPHQPSAAQCFPDPSRMYFGPAFMPSMHGMTAPPMPMMGFDQGPPQSHHARTDGGGECTSSFKYGYLIMYIWMLSQFKIHSLKT